MARGCRGTSRYFRDWAPLLGSHEARTCIFGDDRCPSCLCSRWPYSLLTTLADSSQPGYNLRPSLARADIRPLQTEQEKRLNCQSLPKSKPGSLRFALVLILGVCVAPAYSRIAAHEEIGYGPSY